jgi:hypothetical protein
MTSPSNNPAVFKFGTKLGSVRIISSEFRVRRVDGCFSWDGWAPLGAGSKERY